MKGMVGGHVFNLPVDHASQAFLGIQLKKFACLVALWCTWPGSNDGRVLCGAISSACAEACVQYKIVPVSRQELTSHRPNDNPLAKREGMS